MVIPNVRYRQQKYAIGLNIDGSVTDQKDLDTTQRKTIGINYQRFRDDRWFTDWVLSGEQNDELGIDSRYIIGGGLGRYLIQNNSNQFSLVVGMVASRESFTTGSESDETNLEGKISIKYLHRSLVPESDVSFAIDVYPLLEDLSSFRAETNLTFRYELIDDLFLDLTVYHSYLSDPPPDAAKDDYGVLTSLGYKF
ncbi:MAG: DUF481 domain-containing protein [Pseudomonadales bacterium]